MSLSAWLAGRQARELVRDGQLAAAARLVAPLAAAGYRRALEIQRRVAQAHLDRAGRHHAAGDADAAWADLADADALVPGAAANSALKDALARSGLEQCHQCLELGHPARALDGVDRLRARGVTAPALSAVADAARAWLDAAELADRGQFAAALARLEAAARPLAGPAAAGVNQALAGFRDRAAAFAVQFDRATTSAAAGQWADAAQAAEAALAAAPAHGDLRALKTQAWAALQPGRRPTHDSVVPLARLAVAAGAGPDTRETAHYVPADADTPDAAESRLSGRPSGRFQSGPAHAPGSPLPKRFVLWIDGVGGYLVCLSPRVTVGQAVGDAPVDVPVFAELGKLHAEFSRDADGGYVLEAARAAAVNGAAARRAPLAGGDRVTLGANCQMVFHRPVAISATARLDVVSGHRLPWAVDGILLMDQTLQLGGGGHVPWPDGADGGVLLYRTPTGLAVKCPGRFRVADEPCVDRADVPLPGVVCADGVTFALDPVGR